MALSLYEVTVPTFHQILTALGGVLQKGEAHCAAKGEQADAFVSACLYEDMRPLSFQVGQAAAHSAGALAAVQRGVFSPDMSPPPETFAGLKDAVENALAELARYTPADVNAFEGRDMAFEFKDMRMPFTVENFLLSFTLPNFYFHAATAYDILRHKGVPLGKRDYIGIPRMKR
jgi:hypothetical protein